MCKQLSRKYWIGRHARQFREFRADTPEMSRSANSEAGFGNFCFAVTRPSTGNGTVMHNYRIHKWLWLTQYLVYLFMDARQSLPAATGAVSSRQGGVR